MEYSKTDPNMEWLLWFFSGSINLIWHRLVRHFIDFSMDKNRKPELFLACVRVCICARKVMDKQMQRKINQTNKQTHLYN